jgi:hypothetical protein
MAFMLSKRDCRRDIEENNCRSFDEAAALKFSRYAAMLLMTANKAGYIAVSLPWLVVMML